MIGSDAGLGELNKICFNIFNPLDIIMRHISLEYALCDGQAY
jgi:hypothetical protein